MQPGVSVELSASLAAGASVVDGDTAFFKLAERKMIANSETYNVSSQCASFLARHALTLEASGTTHEICPVDRGDLPSDAWTRILGRLMEDMDQHADDVNVLQLLLDGRVERRVTSNPGTTQCQVTFGWGVNSCKWALPPEYATGGWGTPLPRCSSNTMLAPARHPCGSGPRQAMRPLVIGKSHTRRLCFRPWMLPFATTAQERVCTSHQQPAHPATSTRSAGWPH